MIWKNAIVVQPEIPSAEEFGWKVENDRLKPIFKLFEPISKVCKEIIRCGCKTQCGTRMC